MLSRGDEAAYRSIRYRFESEIFQVFPRAPPCSYIRTADRTDTRTVVEPVTPAHVLWSRPPVGQITALLLWLSNRSFHRFESRNGRAGGI